MDHTYSARVAFCIAVLLSGIASAADLEPIVLSPDGKGFVFKDSQKPFKPWGFNYLGTFGKIYEEYWAEDWDGIADDFREMKKLGANVVRVHLQVGTFMDSPTTAKKDELARLRKLLDLANETGLYLDITGLGCYHLDKIPKWFDELPEKEHWQAQAKFWEFIAETCAGHPAVFCYDLMNEPVVQGKSDKDKSPWLVPEDLGGFYFVQRICNDPGQRDRDEIANAWVEQMTKPIRAKDPKALITVGIIPWAQAFPGVKSDAFYSAKSAKHLDFVSVHFYPKAGEVDKTLVALEVYDIGKPIVVEETFPLSCSIEELDAFIDGAGESVDGWIAHYFGKKGKTDNELSAAIVAKFLEYWLEKGQKWSK
jgi:hypothetical protein